MNEKASPTLSIILLLAVSILACTQSAFAREFYPPSQKISGEILEHRQVKQKLKGLPALQQTEQKSKLDFAANHLDAEECALYVNEELTEKEMRALAEQGILVNPDIYIGPVPDKHPYGFYLATVDYNSLDMVQADDRIVMLASTERLSYPTNNTGGKLINSDDVHNGNGVTAMNGAGVKIAIADSGLDVGHGDLPTPVEAYDMTDGTNTATWGADVSNHATGHGTHVTGTVLGRGTRSSGNTGNGGGAYVGSAPGASLYFYKIGNDTNGASSGTDEIEAMNRAADVRCDIFTMSYGGFGNFMDGSCATCQTIDSIVGSGVTVFISAGNSADDNAHYSVSVPPTEESQPFYFTIDNASGTAAYTDQQRLRVIWRDDDPEDAQMLLFCQNLSALEDLTGGSSGGSVRGAEGATYNLVPFVPAGTTKVYGFVLTNPALTGSTPLVHVYRTRGTGTFNDPDTSYTVTDPAVADEAIAVGAWCHREDWTNFQGNGYTYDSLTQGEVTGFSSRGPRIDGVTKPTICAPGAMTISLRDSDVGCHDPMRVDNDGANLNGSGPAEYAADMGTSMACPMAAGAAALLLEANSSLTPSRIRWKLQSSASKSGTPNNDVGYGLIDILAAIRRLVGDFNNDNDVDDEDLYTLLYSYGATTPEVDLNHDNQVNSEDVFEFAGQWGQ